MIRGEIVEVIDRVKVGTDEFNAPIYELQKTTVDNVLVIPGPPQDISDGNRPDGVIVAFTLHFPKTYLGDLEGRDVLVRGKPFSVIGSPQRYTEGNTPGAWNMQAEVEAVYG